MNRARLRRIFTKRIAANAPRPASSPSWAKGPSTRELQIQLRNQYRQLEHLGMALPRLDEVGFRVFSEADEDGILHYLFSLIGTTNKTLVDVGAGAPVGSNTSNLLVNDGWTGLLLEGDPTRVERLTKFYADCPDTAPYPPSCVNAWVTAENINQLLRDAGLSGEIDLLCIDVDGIDYWLWKAVDVVSPRVVLVEYQCIWGPERSVTVPYDPQFKPIYEGRYGIYNGASLAAFVKLAREKGYRLVGSQRWGYNAFLVRNELGQDLLPEVPAAACFRHPFTKWAIETFRPKIEQLPWVEV
jgi:hypothetical protein